MSQDEGKKGTTGDKERKKGKKKRKGERKGVVCERNKTNKKIKDGRRKTRRRKEKKMMDK